jgi:hypothetical protein
MVESSPPENQVSQTDLVVPFDFSDAALLTSPVGY